MKTSLWVVVTTDPRTSGRPAEAIRIAAGVGAWKKVDVSLYLHGAAVLALSEFADEFVDEDNFNRYLPILREFGHPVYVEAGSALIRELGESPVPFQELTLEELAQKSGQATYLLRF